ncbi:hypothetical protein LXA43DRAFT_467806 [Ganoderma leucocontextum]|nr:hypothetical protein LXA43DRAFT_467806 [Ganoderma leucocontextum]
MSNMTPLVHVYLFNPVTNIITYEPMRTPGAVHSHSPRLQYVPGKPNPRTLGKDTRGLIEDLVVRREHAVFFIATPASTWDPLTNKQRAAKIRSAKIQVRDMELMALDLDAALTMEDDTDPDDDSYSQSDSSYTDTSFTLSISIGDCSGDSFTLEDSLSVADSDGDQDQDGEDHEDQDQGDQDDQSDEDEDYDDDKNEDHEDVRDNVDNVTAPVHPPLPSAATSDSLASDTSFATANSDFSPTNPSEPPARPIRIRIPPYLRSSPEKPSSLRRLTYSASIDESFYSATEGEDVSILGVPTSSIDDDDDDDDEGKTPGALPSLGIQGERQTQKRKADDYEDLRTAKRLKMAHPTGTPTQAAPGTVLPPGRCRCKPPKRQPPPAPFTPSPVVSKPAAQQQTASLKRKREDEEGDSETFELVPRDNSASGPTVKKIRMTPRRRRRPKVVLPLVRKMWDKFMWKKIIAIGERSTDTGSGSGSANKKARRSRAA